MMTLSTKRLYVAGAKNKEFNRQFKKADGEYFKPSIFLSDIQRAAYALVYEGWLIARGEFDESNF